jgi:hypothetical protein
MDRIRRRGIGRRLAIENDTAVKPTVDEC